MVSMNICLSVCMHWCMVSMSMCLSVSVGACSHSVCVCLLQVLLHGISQSVIVFKRWCMISVNLCLCIYALVHALSQYDLCLSTRVAAWSQSVCDCVQALAPGISEFVIVYKCWCMASVSVCLCSSVDAWSP